MCRSLNESRCSIRYGLLLKLFYTLCGGVAAFVHIFCSMYTSMGDFANQSINRIA